MKTHMANSNSRRCYCATRIGLSCVHYCAALVHRSSKLTADYCICHNYRHVILYYTNIPNIKRNNTRKPHAIIATSHAMLFCSLQTTLGSECIWKVIGLSNALSARRHHHRRPLHHNLQRSLLSLYGTKATHAKHNIVLSTSALSTCSTTVTY